jgi:hypothetical protein
MSAMQVTGKCGSVTVRLIPAPRGAGIVAARVPKKVLQMAGIEDCYTSARGSTKTLGNFVKVRAAAPVRGELAAIAPVGSAVHWPHSGPCNQLPSLDGSGTMTCNARVVTRD